MKGKIDWVGLGWRPLGSLGSAPLSSARMTAAVGLMSLSVIASGCSARLGNDGADGADRGDGDGDGDGDGRLPTEEEAAADPSLCVPGIPGTSQLPRLSRLQYDNTIRDLLFLSGSPSTMLAPDSTGSVDQRAWDGYQLAAATVSAQVMADAGARSQVILCTPEGDGDACARQLIQDLGPRAFRRPLTPEEVTRFESLVTERAAVTPTGSFDEVAQLIIEAFLLSPSFLIRGEITEVPEGAQFALSSHEVASRLSYLLWDSMPDDILFAAATAGQLSTPEALLSQAQRMLADPRAHSVVRSFHEHYLHMGAGTRWSGIVRDTGLYPSYDESKSALLSEETERFVEHVVFTENGTFQDLLMRPLGFVNAALAPLYGLDAANFGDALVPTDLDPQSRAGLFTRLGFLASHSYYDRSSPIHRGAFIQKDVLCTPIGTPPPGAEGEPLPTEGLTTNRERVDAQTSDNGCSGCHHDYINPTGFAFEAYDAVGNLQTNEIFSGAPVDTSAVVLIGENYVEVDGPISLMQAVADAPEAHYCYARKWVEFAYRRALNNQDACVVNHLTDKLTAGGYTILDLITDLTQSESFTKRTLLAEVAP